MSNLFITWNYKLHVVIFATFATCLHITLFGASLMYTLKLSTSFFKKNNTQFKCIRDTISSYFHAFLYYCQVSMKHMDLFTLKIMLIYLNRVQKRVPLRLSSSAYIHWECPLFLNVHKQTPSVHKNQFVYLNKLQNMAGSKYQNMKKKYSPLRAARCFRVVHLYYCVVTVISLIFRLRV